jgi:hypothetical protein
VLGHGGRASEWGLLVGALEQLLAFLRKNTAMPITRENTITDAMKLAIACGVLFELKTSVTPRPITSAKKRPTIQAKVPRPLSNASMVL